MSYEVYKIIHLTGVIALFLSLGAMLGASKSFKAAAIGHGVALFLILLGGFGIQAKLYSGQFPSWMIAKIAIWLVLGASLVLIKRKLMPGNGVAILVLVLGVAAAWLGVMRPF